MSSCLNCYHHTTIICLVLQATHQTLTAYMQTCHKKTHFLLARPISEVILNGEMLMYPNTLQKVMEPAKDAKHGLHAAKMASMLVSEEPVAAADAPATAEAVPLQILIRLDNAALIVPVSSKCVLPSISFQHWECTYIPKSILAFRYPILIFLPLYVLATTVDRGIWAHAHRDTAWMCRYQALSHFNTI